jgi:DNA-binding MarR family transcriptional regulator
LIGSVSCVPRRLGQLAREIRQTKPFRSLQQEGTVSLLRTADLLRRSLTRAIEPFGITPQQYNVLRILRGAGDSGLPTLEIAARMIEHAPGITRLMDRLEAKGLVRRERCSRDRRQVLCRIAAPGLQLLARLDGPLRDAEQAFLRPLQREPLRRLIALLDSVRSGQT